MRKKVLVIDIGGTHVKLMLSRSLKRKFDSGPDLGPKELIARTRSSVEGWKFDLVSIGFPAPVRDGRILHDPNHLGPGWCGFDFRKLTGKPAQVINDAALQALGSYHGGRMLFLGFGTGLGSALIWDHTVLSLELCDLPYVESHTLEEHLGKEGLRRLGKKNWQKEVERVVKQLKLAMIADYVVVGGGNAKLLDKLPPGAEIGHNRNAYLGGARLWQRDARTGRRKWSVI